MAAEERASFAFDLEGNAEQESESIASALEQLREKMHAGQDEIKGLNTALRNLKGSGAEDTIKKLKDQLTAKKAVIAGAQQKYLDLGGSLRKLKPASVEAETFLARLGVRAQGAGGHVGLFASKAFDLEKALGAGGLVVGTVALAAAITAVTAAAAAGAVALLKFGFAAASTRRDENLMLQGLTQLRPSLAALYSGFARPHSTAHFLQEQIDHVTANVRISREEVAGFAQEFEVLGLRGRNLQDAIEGASLAAATQGARGVAQFKAMALGAAFAGGSIRKVTDDFRARLGPIAREQMLSLDAQIDKLRGNFGLLFSGLKIKPFLEAVQLVFREFRQGAATADALKAIFEGVFNPLLGGAKSAAPFLVRVLRGAVLGALDLTIWGLRVAIVFKNAFKRVRESVFGGLIDPMKLGRLAIYGIAVSVGLVIAAIGLAIAGFATTITAIFRPDLLLRAGLRIGRRLIDGMISGIKSALGAIKGAVSYLADATVGAFQSAFQIHSPSVLMRERVGVQIARGQAAGIEQGTPYVQRAVQANADAASVGSAPKLAPGRASGGGGVRVGDVNVTVNGAGETGAALKDLIANAVRDAIVGAAIELGART